MASQDLTINLVGRDKSVGSTFTKVGSSAQSAAGKIGKAFGSIGNQIGGEFGGILNNVSEGMEKFSETGGTMGTKMMAAGAGVAALGLEFSHLGSGEKAAHQQLDAAITATGASVSDYTDEIEKAISKGEDFGHSGVDTQNALAKMTETTGDAGKALENMGLVEDIAASKHESLASAAQQLSLGMSGNAKVFKQFGIQLDKTLPQADAVKKAMDELQKKLSGQASAAADTFDGRIKSIQTHLGDWAATMGSKVGPALTMVGSGAMVVGTAMNIMASRAASAATKEAALAVATDTETASAKGQAVASGEAAVATETLGTAAAGAAGELTAEGEAATLSLGPIGLVVAGIAAAGLALNHYGDQIGITSSKMYNALTHVAQAAGGFASAMETDGGVVGQATDAYVTAQIQAGGLADAFNRAGISLTDLTTLVEGSDGAFQTQVQTWVKAGTITQTMAQKLVLLKKAFDDGQISAAQFTQATADLTGTQQTTAQLAQTAADALNNEANALTDLTNGIMDVDKAADSFQASLNTLTGDVKSNGAALTGNTAGAIANRDAIRNSVTAAEASASANLKNGMSVGDVTAKLQSNVAQIEATAIKAGMSKTQVHAMIAEMHLTPSQINTAINVATGGALAAIADVQTGLHQLGKGVVVPIFTNTVTGAVTQGRPMSASGRDYWQGGVTSINERGPEIVDLPSGTRIIPAGLSKTMANNSGKGGDTFVTINLPTVLAPTREHAQLIVSALEPYVARGGKLNVGKGIV